MMLSVTSNLLNMHCGQMTFSAWNIVLATIFFIQSNLWSRQHWVKGLVMISRSVKWMLTSNEIRVMILQSKRPGKHRHCFLLFSCCLIGATFKHIVHSACEFQLNSKGLCDNVRFPAMHSFTQGYLLGNTKNTDSFSNILWYRFLEGR